MAITGTETVWQARCSLMNIKSFVLGLLTGATAAWWLKDAIPAQIDARTAAMGSNTATDLAERGEACTGGPSPFHASNQRTQHQSRGLG